MRLPDYYLTRPPMATGEVVAAFADLYDRHLASGSRVIDYRLGAPKWQFLCWLTDSRSVVLHGSGSPDIEVFEPRRPEDASTFANREAVFAASDGIWAMFYAILDRTAAYSLVNACFAVRAGAGRGPADVRYYFSVNADALDGSAFGDGTVYVLPRGTFARQDDHDEDGITVVTHQWASVEPVRPLGCLAVAPEDFPFLADINGHDVDAVIARAEADPDGFPWRT